MVKNYFSEGSFMIHELTIRPQFRDTDAFGHVNYMSTQNWFDRARTDIYREFSAKMDPREIGLVILKVDVLYQKEIFPGNDVQIRSWVSRIGNKSFTITQEASQNNELCVTGNIVFCGIDLVRHISAPLSSRVREVLSRYQP